MQGMNTNHRNTSRGRTILDLIRHRSDSWSAPRSGEYVPCQLRTNPRKVTR